MKENKTELNQRTNGNKPIKSIPKLYERKEECCGCSACYASCPRSGEEWKESVMSGDKKLTYTGAITMTPDNNGFLYPVINPERCIRCYKCVSACVFKTRSYKVM